LSAYFWVGVWRLGEFVGFSAFFCVLLLGFCVGLCCLFGWCFGYWCILCLSFFIVFGVGCWGCGGGDVFGPWCLFCGGGWLVFFFCVLGVKVTVFFCGVLGLVFFLLFYCWVWFFSGLGFFGWFFCLGGVRCAVVNLCGLGFCCVWCFGFCG